METEIIVPKTLVEAIKYFSDPDTAHNFFVAIRWPDGVTCPYCGNADLSFIRTRRVWHCKECKKRFSAKVGTVMENSALPLETWLTAIWLITGARNGISSCEVGRAIGVCQKTAWFLLHRIRFIMETGSFEKLSGTIEADETYVGGKSKGMHSDRRKAMREKGFPKNCVFGLKERNGEVRTMVIPNAQKETLHEVIAENVAPDAQLFTDAAKGYAGLSETYDHRTVDHNKGEYARVEDEGETYVYTNGMENYWSVLDRCTYGTYIHWSDQHIHRYLAEEDFRYNTRKQKDGERFAKTVAQMKNRRLTYETLTQSHLQFLAPA